MKHLLAAIALTLASVTSVTAGELLEAYNEVASLPKMQSMDKEKAFDVFDGWFGALVFKEAEITCFTGERGNAETTVYGGKIIEAVSKLPDDELVLSGRNAQSLIYIYAHKLSADTYETLIFIDLAYQGQTVAIIGKMDSQLVDALRDGKVVMDARNHSITVDAPVLRCD